MLIYFCFSAVFCCCCCFSLSLCLLIKAHTFYVRRRLLYTHTDRHTGAQRVTYDIMSGASYVVPYCCLGLSFGRPKHASLIKMHVKPENQKEIKWQLQPESKSGCRYTILCYLTASASSSYCVESSLYAIVMPAEFSTQLATISYLSYLALLCFVAPAKTTWKNTSPPPRPQAGGIKINVTLTNRRILDEVAEKRNLNWNWNRRRMLNTQMDINFIDIMNKIAECRKHNGSRVERKLCAVNCSDTKNNAHR